MKTQTQQSRATLSRWSLAFKWAKRLSNPNVPVFVRVHSGEFQRAVEPTLTNSIDLWLYAFAWAKRQQQQKQSRN